MSKPGSAAEALELVTSREIDVVIVTTTCQARMASNLPRSCVGVGPTCRLPSPRRTLGEIVARARSANAALVPANHRRKIAAVPGSLGAQARDFLMSNPACRARRTRARRLAELVNIGVSRAAVSLRTMVGQQVLLSVPSLELVDRPTAAVLIREREIENLVVVRQDFTGAFSGQALLIFPETNSLELVRAVTGELVPADEAARAGGRGARRDGECRAEPSASPRWPICSSGRLIFPFPRSCAARPPSFSNSAPTYGPEAVVLFLYINFAIDDRNIRGYIAMLLDLPSLRGAPFVDPRFHRPNRWRRGASVMKGSSAPDAGRSSALQSARGAWIWNFSSDVLLADARFAGLTGLDPIAAADGEPGARNSFTASFRKTC